MRCRVVLAGMLVFTVTSCMMKPSGPPREPASAAKVERIAGTFEELASAHVKAWFPGDAQGGVEDIRALCTDDIVHHDETFDAHIVGIEDVLAMASDFLLFFSSAEAEVKGQFIGAEDGLVLYELWDLGLEGHQFTRDDPLLEVDLLETRDGLISYWTLFYGLDAIDNFRALGFRSTDDARALLASYASLWSSGDPDRVGDLYATEAVREDTIFDERQAGREAITSFAQSVFVSYPEAHWDLLRAFGEGKGEDPMTGGLFAITVGDAGEESCEIRTAVLLQTSEGEIVHESVYYEPGSLIACGWAE